MERKIPKQAKLSERLGQLEREMQKLDEEITRRILRVKELEAKVRQLGCTSTYFDSYKTWTTQNLVSKLENLIQSINDYDGVNRKAEDQLLALDGPMALCEAKYQVNIDAYE